MPRKLEESSEAEKNLVKAIIPAAGLGKRFHPLSLVLPKELLPVNRRPLIQWAIEEVLASNIRDIGIVIRKGKEVIKNYFELLVTLSDPEWKHVREKLEEARLQFIFQRKPLGLGNAIYEANSFINNSPFLMVIPDQIVISEIPAVRQLLDATREDSNAVWSTVVRIPQKEAKFFSGAREFVLKNQRGNIWDVAGFQTRLRQPGEDVFVGFGRTFFPAGSLRFFTNEFLNPATGEVDLLLSFEMLFREYRNYAVKLEGEPMDLGTWLGYERFSLTANRPILPEMGWVE
jgi:UTP--glucose-1-phosphate uridylyltransferase